MWTRDRRFFFLSTLTLVALALGLAGCAWGKVTDSKTGEPIVGADVTFQDGQGNTATTTTGAGGLYAFDAAKGQTIPAAGSTTYTISAPGYDTITVQRNVAYDDNQSAIWEIQGFVLTREGEEPPPSEGFRLAIDANPLASGIQTSRSVVASAPFSVDIVLVDPPATLGAFSFHLRYDDAIIWAPEVADVPGPSVDDNPDANQSALGPNWDCSILEVDFPTGDKNPATGPEGGEATINCWDVIGPWQLSSTGVIASVVFVPIGYGTTELSLADVLLGDSNAAEIGSCNPILGQEVTCETASITVQ